MSNKVVLTVSTTIVVLAMIVGMKAMMSKMEIDCMLYANIEALAGDEQPNTVMCIFDPNYDCEALHPTDPDKDQIRYYAKWW